MFRFYSLLFFLFLSLSGLIAQPQLDLIPFASGLNQPVVITHANDYRVFVVQQNGIIRILGQDGSVFSSPFLDITDRVNDSGSERGLLGLAFHPDYADNGLFYVNYTGQGGDTYVSSFSVSDSSPDIADPDSETILLSFDQPFSNHNGGQIDFGPDGYLYIGTGDGGSANDPQNNSQNTQNLLGKILRIDVDNPDPGAEYGIPDDNPFVGDPMVLDEIWALGLRNPWRFSFDRLTGDLWIADVGQNEWEEVNRQPAGSPGGENYGWRCYEGNEPFITNGCGDPSDYTFPTFVYPHTGINGCSVTGGYVYRGCRYPGMYGHFIMADYCSGQFWSLVPDGMGGYASNTLINSANFQFTTFGEDSQGELFVAGYQQGVIYRVTETSQPSFEVTAESTETTCETADDGVVNLDWPGTNDPVTVNWSNGAMGVPAEGLLPGNYTATVTGGNGCILTLDVDVDAGTPDSISINGLGVDSLVTDSGFESYQWFQNGNSITNAIDSIFVPTGTGLYSVIAIDEFGCIHYSPTISIFVQNTEDILAGQLLECFPNPYTQSFLVQVPEGASQFRVFDTQGQLLESGMIRSGLEQIELGAEWPSGVFVLQVLGTEGRMWSAKVVRL
jgi:glucose/arabinose dehydrogenase